MKRIIILLVLTFSISVTYSQTTRKGAKVRTEKSPLAQIILELKKETPFTILNNDNKGYLKVQVSGVVGYMNEVWWIEHTPNEQNIVPSKPSPTKHYSKTGPTGRKMIKMYNLRIQQYQNKLNANLIPSMNSHYRLQIKNLKLDIESAKLWDF